MDSVGGRRERWGHPWIQLCCPRPQGLREQGICGGSYQAPLKTDWLPRTVLASALLVFRACPGNLSREQCQKGLHPLAGLPRAIRPARERDFDWWGLSARQMLPCHWLINAAGPAPLTSWFQFVAVTGLITFPVLAGLQHTLGLLCPTHVNRAVTWRPDWWKP